MMNEGAGLRLLNHEDGLGIGKCWQDSKQWSCVIVWSWHIQGLRLWNASCHSKSAALLWHLGCMAEIVSPVIWQGDGYTQQTKQGMILKGTALDEVRHRSGIVVCLLWRCQGSYWRITLRRPAQLESVSANVAHNLLGLYPWQIWQHRTQVEENWFRLRN